ncbi:hypothetical protein [Streptomyces sp. NPDC093568]|uniref:hypothetical protein n=1 Tax=Streptomyces sp. NPDC093568 TaxID=3366041 RepID=UPI0037FA92B0
MGAMSESVSVRCPACRREHVYTAPAYPCACGAPVAPPLDPAGTATPVTHRAWDDEWVGVRCGACDHESQWPRPELGCPCGTVLLVPVARTATRDEAQPPRTPAPRRPFQPVMIRTARDAVTAAAVYLRWLGYRDVHRSGRRPTSGVAVTADGLLAQVDPTVEPASLRDVECLWLTAMAESVPCVYFTLAGYSPDARARADSLGVPLFVLDLTGTPQPVNSLADELDAAGAS